MIQVFGVVVLICLMLAIGSGALVGMDKYFMAILCVTVLLVLSLIMGGQ